MMIRVTAVLFAILSTGGLFGFGIAQFEPIIESVLEATEAQQIECTGGFIDRLAENDFSVSETICAVTTDPAAIRFLVANVDSGIAEVADQGFAVFGRDERPEDAIMAVIHLPSLSALGIAVFVLHDGGAIFFIPLISDGLAKLSEPDPKSPPARSAADPLELYDSNNNGRISCSEAREHGIAPVTSDHPAYQYMTDRNQDGVVCE